MWFALLHVLSSDFLLCFRLLLLFSCSFSQVRPYFLSSLASLPHYKVKCSIPSLLWCILRAEGLLAHVTLTEDKVLVHCGNPEAICFPPTILEKYHYFQTSCQWTRRSQIAQKPRSPHPQHKKTMMSSSSARLSLQLHSQKQQWHFQCHQPHIGLINVAPGTSEADTSDSLQSHLEARQIIQGVKNVLGIEFRALFLPSFSAIRMPKRR